MEPEGQEESQLAKESFDKEIQFLRMLVLTSGAYSNSNSPSGSAFRYIPSIKRSGG